MAIYFLFCVALTLSVCTGLAFSISFWTSRRDLRCSLIFVGDWGATRAGFFLMDGIRSPALLGLAGDVLYSLMRYSVLYFYTSSV